MSHFASEAMLNYFRLQHSREIVNRGIRFFKVALFALVLLHAVGYGNLIDVYGQDTSSQPFVNSTSSSLDRDIQSQAVNQSNEINLLDLNTFIWKTVNEAYVLQTDNELDLIVDTDSAEKLYNRAYLQTKLNSTTITDPLDIAIVYSSQSLSGNNASLAVEIRDKGNNSIISSYGLEKNSTNARFPILQNIVERPIEIRLYVITEDPGSHVLTVKQFRILQHEQTQGNNTK